MNTSVPFAFLLLSGLCLCAAEATPSPVPDPRHLSNGWTIPSSHYADQPYIVRTDDGAWLCVITTRSEERRVGKEC